MANAAAQSSVSSSANQLARDIFKELIEINTTDSSGNTTQAAEAIARRLKSAGFADADVKLLGPNPRKGNLVVRYRGASSTRKPLLLLAHLDVVEARREDWSLDPFTLTEKDGYFYGRGTSDDKAQAALWIANLIRYKHEGYTPNRDIIVALTADEEGGDFNGVTWLLANHKDLVDAEYVLNEGGNGQIKNGKKILNELQASEKVYLSFQLEVKNPGGHSSLPVKDNAIYHLSQGLARLAGFEFPMKLNEVTRAFFSRMAGIVTGPIADDMKGVAAATPDSAAVARLSGQSAYYNALLRTTCVATRLIAGHADNALPQMARATVNCRLLPGESPADVQQTLVRVLSDPAITVTPIGTPTPSPPAPLIPEVLRAVERATTAVWRGVPVVPVMGTGATDGLYFRNAGIPTFGVSGLFEDVDDNREHGRDERIGVAEFFEAQEFLYVLVKELSGASITSRQR